MGERERKYEKVIEKVVDEISGNIVDRRNVSLDMVYAGAVVAMCARCKQWSGHCVAAGLCTAAVYAHALFVRVFFGEKVIHLLNFKRRLGGEEMLSAKCCPFRTSTHLLPSHD